MNIKLQTEMHNDLFLSIIEEINSSLTPIWKNGKPPYNCLNYGPHYIFPGSERPVSIGKIESYFIHNTVKISKAKIAFEIGTGFGVSSWWIGHAMRNDGEWFGSIDNFSEGEKIIERKKFIDESSHKLHLEKINHYFEAESPKDLDKIIGKKRLDIIFIDGHHYQDAPISDFKSILKFTTENSIIIMHDVQEKYTINNALKYAQEIGWKIKTYQTSCGIAICSRQNSFFAKSDQAYEKANKLSLI